MSETRTLGQNLHQTTEVAEEKNFELFLPAVVTGKDAEGKEFAEKTELISMSASKAHFGLRSKVTIGTKLKVVLDIPKTLILENHLKLQISGDVVYAKADLARDDNKQQISIKVDRIYKIQPIDN